MTNKTKVITASDFNLLIQKGRKADVEKKIELSQDVIAPIDKGQKVGHISFLINGEEIGKVDAITAEAVEKVTVGKAFVRLVKHWLNSR